MSTLVTIIGWAIALGAGVELVIELTRSRRRALRGWRR